jgi:hypothetical protein
MINKRRPNTRGELIERVKVRASFPRLVDGNTRDHRRPGRPRVTSRRQDNHIRLVHLRNRFQTSNLTARSITGLRPISSRTVRNRLREHNIRLRRPAIVQFCCLDTVLKCDVVGLSLDERNDLRLNNFIPIA